MLGQNRGFTESHQILFRVDKEKGGEAAQVLEKGGIIANMNMVPGDESPLRPSGIRLGVQELTRLGMKEEEMKIVAKFFEKLLIKKEDTKKIKDSVTPFKKKYRFQKK